MYRSELLRCAECTHTYEDLIDDKERDNTFKCPECGQESVKRTFGVPNVRTSKTSATFLDGTKRFDGLRRQQMLKKEKAEARARLDLVSEKKINKEIKQSKESK